jgi:hypothetical protein
MINGLRGDASHVAQIWSGALSRPRASDGSRKWAELWGRDRGSDRRPLDAGLAVEGSVQIGMIESMIDQTRGQAGDGTLKARAEAGLLLRLPADGCGSGVCAW